jgi:hypothetical protein
LTIAGTDAVNMENPSYKYVYIKISWRIKYCML